MFVKYLDRTREYIHTFDLDGTHEHSQKYIRKGVARIVLQKVSP